MFVKGVELRGTWIAFLGAGELSRKLPDREEVTVVKHYEDDMQV